MMGEPTTACQTGGLRARNRPRTASRVFDGAIHTEAWPGPVATKRGAARGGLGDCRSYSWSWARPRCAGRGLTRGGAAKRGLPRATMKPPRCGSERHRAFVHDGFAIGDRPCETVHPWNTYRNRDQGGLSCPFTSPGCEHKPQSLTAGWRWPANWRQISTQGAAMGVKSG